MSAYINEDLSGSHRADEHTKAERSPARYWMKHDVKAFAFETATADAEGAGALILLRGHYFITGSLPKTDAECAKVCRLSARKFSRIRPWLFSFFDDEGRDAELDGSIEEIERKIENRRDAGRRGGAGKALALAKQMPKQNASESDSQSELYQGRETKAPAPPPEEPRARECDGIVQEVLGALPVSARVHPGWRGLSAWIAQLLSDGAERVDIVVGVLQCLRSLNDRPPTSFSYFSAAIERAREVRTRPLPQAVAPLLDQAHQLGPAGDRLKRRLGNEVFAAWFSQAKVVGECGDTVTLSVDTKFKRFRIVSEYEAACIDAFSALNPSITRVVVLVTEGMGLRV